jgi:hypothetical protein
MINERYDRGSQMIRIINREIIEQEDKIEKEKKEKMTMIELKLPELKGLRTNVLKMIFEKLDNKELLKMGMVNKEFYRISREDRFWKVRIQKEFPFLFSKSEKDFSENQSYGRFKYAKEGTNFYCNSEEIGNEHLKTLMKYEFKKNSSFCEFWNIRNELLVIKYDFDAPKRRSKFNIKFN